MKRAWVALWALFAMGAAEGATAVVAATGDCADIELLGNAQLLASASRARSNIQFLDPAEARARMFPPPGRSPQQIARMVESARRAFYDGKPDVEVQSLFAEALAEISRMPPGSARWDLYKKAELTRALVDWFTKGGRAKQEVVGDAFRRVLRLDARHPLDTRQFPPDAASLYEQLRAAIAQAPKSQLSVQSSPEGADVFLDGFPVGKTPLALPVTAGKYSLTAVNPEGIATSPRAVELKPSESFNAQLDFTVEAALWKGRGLCFKSEPPLSSQRALAAQLSEALGASATLLVTLHRPTTDESGSAELLASWVDARGNAVRQGSLPLPKSGEVPQGIEELADYIVSGKPSAKVLPGEPSFRLRPQESKPPDFVPAKGAPRSSRPATLSPWASRLGIGGLIALSAGGAVALAAKPQNASLDGLRTAGYVTSAAGAAAAVTGAGFFVAYLLQKNAEEPVKEVGVVRVSPGSIGPASVALELPLP